jgi:hypothetical protein
MGVKGGRVSVRDNAGSGGEWSCLDGSNPKFTKCMFSNEYYMTVYYGLTLACSDSWTNSNFQLEESSEKTNCVAYSFFKG